MVHPDKLNMSKATSEEVVKAGLIFEGLREAWGQYLPGQWKDYNGATAAGTSSSTASSAGGGGGGFGFDGSGTGAPPPPPWQQRRSNGPAAPPSSSSRQQHQQHQQHHSSDSVAPAGGGVWSGVIAYVSRSKASGNDLFSAGDYTLATTRYKAALDAMTPAIAIAAARAVRERSINLPACIARLC